jgi:uncharacterized coiled-coil DUF342 family protein
MQNFIATEISLKTRADYKAAIEQCLAEMQHLHEQMARDQEDIDRLRAETKTLLAALQAAWAKAMFKQLYALARQLVTLMQDVQKLKADGSADRVLPE